jgi:hypothetical protein
MPDSVSIASRGQGIVLGRYSHRSIPAITYEVCEIFRDKALIRSSSTQHLFLKPLSWCVTFLQPLGPESVPNR